MTDSKETEIVSGTTIFEAVHDANLDDSGGAVARLQHPIGQLEVVFALLSASHCADRRQRYISQNPIICFGLTLQASWVGIALTFQASMFNGGPVTLIYGIIIATLGSTALAASLGEMASMYDLKKTFEVNSFLTIRRKPTVGAQYRWTAQHTPRKLDPAFWGLLQGIFLTSVKTARPLTLIQAG